MPGPTTALLRRHRELLATLKQRHCPATGKWRLTRDRWHTGFVDALGTGGLLGQVEGRTVADVLAWLAATPLTWRKSIEYVAIDMSATYRAAVRT
ncbi:transposase, partial [Streptomyces chartreusis]|uniref:transposase n=1 Tax=Streptomyces chartreusis TaxID=1969 RepID=UPI00382517D8